MKKIIIINLILVCVLTVILGPSRAYGGSKQSHRWEGVAIGMGVALLGSAIYHHHKAYSHQTVPPAVMPDWRYPYKKTPHFKKQFGHWEIRETWIPPTCKRVWNPGHYNRHGEWVTGRWIEIVLEEGYWIERKVWVSSR